MFKHSPQTEEREALFEEPSCTDSANLVTRFDSLVSQLSFAEVLLSDHLIFQESAATELTAPEMEFEKRSLWYYLLMMPLGICLASLLLILLFSILGFILSNKSVVDLNNWQGLFN